MTGAFETLAPYITEEPNVRARFQLGQQNSEARNVWQVVRARLPRFQRRDRAQKNAAIEFIEVFIEEQQHLAYKLIQFLAQRSFARERQIAQHHIGDFQHAFEVEANVVVDRYAPSRAARTLFREAIVFIVVQSKESDRFRE